MRAIAVCATLSDAQLADFGKFDIFWKDKLAKIGTKTSMVEDFCWNAFLDALS